MHQDLNQNMCLEEGFVNAGDNISHPVHPPPPFYSDLGLPPLQSCPAGRKTSLQNTQEFILKRAASTHSKMQTLHVNMTVVV